MTTFFALPGWGQHPNPEGLEKGLKSQWQEDNLFDAGYIYLNYPPKGSI